MKPSIIRTAVPVSAVVLGVLIRWLYLSCGRNPAPPAVPVATAPPHSAPAMPQHQSVAVATVTRSPPHDYSKEFRAQQDYWAYAHELLPKANAGDADAQFYLGKILRFCDRANKSFFENMRQRITLDEALQVAAEQHRSQEQTQAIYTRCHAFATEDSSSLGDAREWFNKATDAGQPAASAIIAGNILWRQYLEIRQKAGGTPELGPPVRPGADPQALLLQAARSQDPEALYAIAGVALLRGQMRHDDDPTDGYAWLILACQRGYPCNGDWITIGCPNCGPDNPDPQSALMAQAGDYWPAAQARAAQLGASLEAGQWDRLGFNAAQSNE